MRDASEAGFTEFVRARSTALLRTAVLLAGGDRGHAEDLVQGVLERMYVRWDRIDGPPEAYAGRDGGPDLAAGALRRRGRGAEQAVDALPSAARLRIGTERADIGNTVAAQNPVDQRLQWMDAGGRPVFPVGTDAGAAWPGGPVPTADAAGQALSDVVAPLLAPAARDAYTQGKSLWFAAGSTPDDSRLVAGEQTIDDDPSRVCTPVALS